MPSDTGHCDRVFPAHHLGTDAEAVDVVQLDHGLSRGDQGLKPGRLAQAHENSIIAVHLRRAKVLARDRQDADAMLARGFRDQLLEPHRERPISAGMTRVHLSRPPFAAARAPRRSEAPGCSQARRTGEIAASAPGAQQFGDVDPEQRASYDAEVGKRRIAAAEIGVGAKHPAEVLLGRQVVQLRGRVGDHSGWSGWPIRSQKNARWERGSIVSPDLEAKTKGPVGRQLLGVAVNGAGVTRVGTRRSSPPAPTPNAWRAPKQAGATHAAPQDMG